MVSIASGFRRAVCGVRNNPIFFGGSEISVGGGVEWRWATAGVATAAVALRAEVSRGQRRCVELMKTVSLDREKPLFPVLSSALFGY